MFDRLVGIDSEFKFFGELSDLCRGAFEIECNTATGFGAEDDVLSDGLRLDQHEVLVDHADAECNRIVRRLDITHLPVDEDLAAISGVKAVSDTHRRRLSRAVL